MVAVKSTLRALLVIELLTAEERGLTFAEITERLGLPKSSMYGVLHTMVDRGHLRLHPGTRRYQLGSRLWEAGQAYGRSFDLSTIAQPHLEHARDELRETVQLAVLDGLENVYIAKVQADQRLVLASAVGMRLPSYATGLGKVLLADLTDEDLLARIGDRPLERFTEATITEVDALRAELAEVRTAGYARDEGEYTRGVFCIAAPVRDHSGRVAAAMSVSVPQVRVSPAKEQQVIEALTRHADALARSLGHRRDGDEVLETTPGNVMIGGRDIGSQA